MGFKRFQTTKINNFSRSQILVVRWIPWKIKHLRVRLVSKLSNRRLTLIFTHLEKWLFIFSNISLTVKGVKNWNISLSNMETITWRPEAPSSDYKPVHPHLLRITSFSLLNNKLTALGLLNPFLKTSILEHQMMALP